MEEPDEDRILELMDFVAGFCAQDQRIWDEILWDEYGGLVLSHVSALREYDCMPMFMSAVRSSMRRTECSQPCCSGS